MAIKEQIYEPAGEAVEWPAQLRPAALDLISHLNILNWYVGKLGQNLAKHIHEVCPHIANGGCEM